MYHPIFYYIIYIYLLYIFLCIFFLYYIHILFYITILRIIQQLTTVYLWWFFGTINNWKRQLCRQRVLSKSFFFCDCLSFQWCVWWFQLRLQKLSDRHLCIEWRCLFDVDREVFSMWETATVLLLQLYFVTLMTFWTSFSWVELWLWCPIMSFCHEGWLFRMRAYLDK